MASQRSSMPLHRRYDEDDQLAAVRSRYAEIPPRIPKQLSVLANSVQFAEVVRELRYEGWKDWHILLAIGNIAFNLLFESRAIPTAPNRLPDAETARGFHEPTDFEPFPPTEFTAGKLRFALQLAALATAKGSGFQFPRPDVRPQKILRFLRARFRFFDLDVDHECFFPLAEG